MNTNINEAAEKFCGQWILEKKDTDLENISALQLLKDFAAQFQQQQNKYSAGVWVKVNHMIAKLPENTDINIFEIDMNGDFLLAIQNGKVVNAVNGWGNNCKDTFKDIPVTFLYESQPAPQPDIDIEAMAEK